MHTHLPTYLYILRSHGGWRAPRYPRARARRPSICLEDRLTDSLTLIQPSTAVAHLTDEQYSDLKEVFKVFVCPIGSGVSELALSWIELPPSTKLMSDPANAYRIAMAPVRLPSLPFLRIRHAEATVDDLALSTG